MDRYGILLGKEPKKESKKEPVKQSREARSTKDHGLCLTCANREKDVLMEKYCIDCRWLPPWVGKDNWTPGEQA